MKYEVGMVIFIIHIVDDLENYFGRVGTITHIDNNQNDDCYQRYEKTFLDFFMIANASKIFLLKGKLMHRSGYPFAASKLYNKEFNVIEY